MDQSLDQIPASDDPVHLLLIADSKVGKSVYAAQAAIDGFNVAYADGDNGVTALRWAIKSQEVMKRIQYFPVRRMSLFLSNLLRSKTLAPFYWIPGQDRLWSKLATNMTPETIVWKFDIQKFPRTSLLAIDSWTSTANDALGIGSPEQDAKLLDGTDQGIYGDASINLNYICNMLQKIPCHVIVQAHGTVYERYEKPINTLGKAMKQGEMKLIESVDVPQSSSRPHGQMMASRFNHIGWMYISGTGEPEIDFTQRKNRIGGGPPNTVMKAKDLPFSKLTFGVPPQTETDWFTKTTHGELTKPAPTVIGVNLDKLKIGGVS